MARKLKVGSLKPLCLSCLRSAFGGPKRGGWWCFDCECWIVKPPRKKESPDA